VTDLPVLVWFRQDLRLSDNPALDAAVKTGASVIPVFVRDDDSAGEWRPGGASRWWLHQSLTALTADLRKRDSRLVLRSGTADRVILDLVQQTGATAVYWNRLHESWAVHRDAALKVALEDLGVAVHGLPGNLAFEPWTIRTGGGGPYRVFSPFMKACLRHGPPDAPLPAPKGWASPDDWPASACLDAWALQPTQPDWAGGLRDHWCPGETGARDRFSAFLDNGLDDYTQERDQMARESTSRLSPHLHFGEISIRSIWHALDHREAEGARSVTRFRTELIWREFAHHLLFHYPTLPEANWRETFDAFPWVEDDVALKAWQGGNTGYPLVDAGMRELWVSGYMHNRVRMVAASFLIKHLAIHWRQGEDWFWDTLVDADLANNAAGWQWVAGSGADAAPFFRIFNPVLQGQRFDSDGAYVRRWLPVLKDLPDKYLHAPWTAPDDVLRNAGVSLGGNYPRPIVDHAAARARALEGYERVKQL